MDKANKAHYGVLNDGLIDVKTLDIKDSISYDKDGNVEPGYVWCNHLPIITGPIIFGNDFKILPDGTIVDTKETFRHKIFIFFRYTLWYFIKHRICRIQQRPTML